MIDDYWLLHAIFTSVFTNCAHIQFLYILRNRRLPDRTEGDFISYLSLTANSRSNNYTIMKYRAKNVTLFYSISIYSNLYSYQEMTNV